ncbi:MAG: hypothetical protein GYA55_03910 [SAR324 cluster bacterium]|uniref:Uncharacterized protein n=1 Tax=SAR324 cluster bacterium TaxID=2024889 RepID=A0A7X9IIQ7_9DELT|nr:hypothetical protein [SAR324 cluster bacterium]
MKAVLLHISIFFLLFSTMIASAVTRGSSECRAAYTKIAEELERANHCTIDSDCSLLPIGGRYVAFGCYHYVNKDIKIDYVLNKISDYAQKCSKMINDSMQASPVHCVEHRCEAYS